MNGRKIKEKISLRHFLTRNILILIFAAIIIAAVTLFAGNSLGSALVKQPDVSVVLNQSSIYEKEDYKSVKAGSSLGENGYYQILDENANLLYTSDKTKANSLTLESLDYVPDAANGTIFTIELQKNEYGEDYYFIHRIYTDSNNNVETGLAVIDINQNILYSNMEINSSKISQNTINILLNNSEDGLSQTVAQKHRFETQSGKIRYLILYTDSDTAIYITEYMRAIIISIVLFILCMALVVWMITKRTVNYIVRPLSALEGAIKNFSKGKWEQIEECDGPEEFSMVIHTFNDMEHQLSESEKERAELENQRQKMLGDISHDIKTPVTVIRGYSSAIADHIVPQEEQEKYLRIISQKAALLSELVDSFSDYSRLQHPDFQMNFEKTDLSEYLREYAAEKYEELELQDYPMDISIPENAMEADIDRQQLKRVFENIIVNSVKHTPAHTVISVSLQREGENAVISLGDNGPGIPQALRKTIFEPFVTGDDSRTSGTGSGLGLSIVKKIVEAHHGTVELIDTKKGTVFHIVLPLHQAAIDRAD